MTDKVFGVFIVLGSGPEMVCRTFADAEELVIDLANEYAYEVFLSVIHHSYDAPSLEQALYTAECAFTEWYVREIPLI